jgi:glycosyltransferase involved in cell wall biosynthesis
MKLLVIMAHYPFPPKTGSSIVAYKQLEVLSKNHSLHLICSDLQQQMAESPKFVEGSDLVIRKKISRLTLMARVLLGGSAAVARYSSRKMNALVRQTIARNDFDVILAYELIAVQYCPKSAYRKLIVNVEDPQSLKHLRHSELPLLSWKQKAEWRLNAFLTRQYESALLPRLAKVLTLSQADMADLERQGNYQNIGCTPYGVDPRPDTDILRREDRTEGMIVFSGNMFHTPNVDGILFFLRDIFPAVLNRHPSATLWIVGAEPDRRIHEAAAPFGAQTVITGRVDDVSRYLRRAMVSICPIRLKIGVQTKILEALSWATPVVTTSAGNSGIGARSGVDLFVEDNPVDFGRRVVALLSGENWDGLSACGRQLASERFSWKNSVAELERHIGSIKASAS